MSEETLSRKLHPDLHQMLLEFHGVNGHRLRAVWRVYEDESLDKIILEFDQDSLVVEAVSADDTVVFHLTNNSGRNTDGWIDSSRSEPWSGFIGETFGWGWITISQQDAIDGVLLSFCGIIPQIMLNVMASSIKESVIHEIADENA